MLGEQRGVRGRRGERRGRGEEKKGGEREVGTERTTRCTSKRFVLSKIKKIPKRRSRVSARERERKREYKSGRG